MKRWNILCVSASPPRVIQCSSVPWRLHSWTQNVNSLIIIWKYKSILFHSKFDFPLSDWPWGQLLPHHSGPTKLKPRFPLLMGEIWWCPMLGCSFVHALQQRIFAHIIFVSLGSRIFNFYAASKQFCCFSVKIWVVSLHYVCSFVKLYMELVYPIIGYCFVCSSGAASWKSHWLFNLHLQKSQPTEFQHIGLVANISSPHHAGPSSSTLYQIINLNWSDKQQPEALLA